MAAAQAGLTPAENTARVADPSSAVVTTIAVGANPIAVARSADGTLAYVANLNSNSLSIIDTEIDQVVATVGAGPSPRDVDTTPDGRYVLVTNQLALDWDDLDVGPSTRGYVEPSEAAWEGIEKAVDPCFQDLERRVKLRHEDEATELCQGIVFGLYRAEQRGFELLEYAEDCPSQLATHAVNIWQRRRRHCAPPRPFVEKFTPGWDWLIR